MRLEQIDTVAYTGIVLQDTNVISNASSILKQRFPRFLTMSRAHGVQLPSPALRRTHNANDPMAQLADFYQLVTEKSLTPAQRELAATTLKEVLNS